MKLKKVQITPMNGKDELRFKIKNIRDIPGFRMVTSLGVIRDSDSNPQDTFKSICDSLKYARLPSPSRCLETVGEHPKVTVMLMPKENTPGMLEDLCLESVRTDPAFSCMEKYFECLESKEIPRPGEMSKAKVHVFLASRPKSDVRLGVAAEKKYWPFDCEVFEELKAFLRVVTA